jgi:hypothetical protein
MVRNSARSLPYLLQRALSTLDIHGKDLAAALHVSPRTMSRWRSGTHRPTRDQLHALVRSVHPRDAALASEIAAAMGEALSTIVPAPPPTVAPVDELYNRVDGLVCAAAEAMNVPPAAVRPALAAAFGRARAMQMSLDAIATALTSARATKS